MPRFYLYSAIRTQSTIQTEKPLLSRVESRAAAERGDGPDGRAPAADGIGGRDRCQPGAIAALADEPRPGRPPDIDEA